MELLGAMPFSQGWSSVSTGDSMVMMCRYVCGHVCGHVRACVFYEIHALSHKPQLPWLLSLSCSVGV